MHDASIYETTDTKYGLMMFLKNDVAIGDALRTYGEFAESDNILFRRYLHAGDCALDIGSHVGVMAAAMSDAVGIRGTVMTFEPQDALFVALVNNIRINGRNNVNAHNLAVSDMQGQMKFPVPDYTHTANFGAIGSAHQTKTVQTVESITLDMLIQHTPRLIKIDVEGMEGHVLRGGHDLIKTCAPIIFVEANDREPIAEEMAFLRAQGYRLFWHASPFWRRNNAKGETKNIFPSTKNPFSIRADTAILALPPHVPDPDDMIEVDDLFEPEYALLGRIPLITE